VNSREPAVGLAESAMPLGTTAGVRETNLSLVLRTALAAEKDAPLSRAGVAAVTSLTRSTVSRLARR